MAQNYLRTMIGSRAKALQEQAGSLTSYARMMEGGDDADPLGPREREFIAASDSFYLASVTEDGWPYVQHRGGPPGFLKVLDPHRVAFADFRGNRQFLSTANLLGNRRVALMLMDYAERRRLKVVGHARIVSPGEDPHLRAMVDIGDYKAEFENIIVIDVVGIDWNCPQHIARRFTEAQVEAVLAPLRDEIMDLRAQLARSKELDG